MPDTQKQANNHAPDAAPKIDPVDFISNLMANTLGFVVRGFAASLSNVQPEMVLLATCRAMARTVGALYGGDMLGVAKLRKACIDEFTNSLLKAEIVEFPAAEPKADAASH